MRLIIESDWECFTEIMYDLADFSIITGLNGVGKTMLLEALSKRLSGSIPIRILDTTDKEIPYDAIAYYGLGTIKPKIELESVRMGNMTHQQINPLSTVATNYVYYKDKPESQIPSGYKKVAKKLNKNVNSLNSADIIDYYDIADGDPHTGFFSERLGEAVGYYALLKHDNDYSEYENNKYGAKNYYLSDEEFEAMHGKDPALYFNKILESCNLPYEVISNKINRGQYFSVSFRNLLTGEKTNQIKLSSGEEIILSMALAVYNFERGGKTNVKLLLLDEADASLHPSAIKKLLHSVQGIFIDNGIKVIMTTHSPSTIALAPESAGIYLLEKEPTKFTKLTPDEAINKLTAGIPTLSVRIENRRVVFVESKHDATNLDKLFFKIKNNLKSDFSLSFIPSDITDNGTCEKVKDLLAKLSNVPSVYGLIDFDGRNVRSRNLMVLGQGNRDGIENYILDPVILGAYLVRELIIAKAEVGMEDFETYLSIAQFDADRLQAFSNEVVKILFHFNPDVIASGKTLKSKYGNGLSINIPEWYYKEDDHAVKNFILKRFDKLNTLKNGNKLSDDILSKVIDDMPELIPQDIIDTMHLLVG